MSSRARYISCLAIISLFAWSAGAAELAPDSGSLSGNLRLWLRMPEINYDPGTGIWTDSGPNGNDAAVVDGYVGPTLSTGENAAVFAQPFSAVHFDPSAQDLLKSEGANTGVGLTDVTIFHIIKLAVSGGTDQRGVGFGEFQEGERTNCFNLSFDMTVRKNNGLITGKNQDLPLDQYVIYAGRMNPSSVDMWLNTTGTLELAFTNSGDSYTTNPYPFYVGDLRYTPAGDFDIAEVVVYDRALSDAEVEGVSEWLQAYVGRIASTGASGATPGHEAADVSRDITLSWTPLPTAVKRDIYFGSSFEDVNSATVPTAAGLDVNSFDPGRLEFGTAYYWRVDEVNGAPDNTVFKGQVWNFEVEPYSIEIPGDTIVVTASSVSNDFSTAQKTIDGSGLDPNTGAHSLDPETMWFTATVDLDPWIQYEFDDVKKVDAMTVWNSNGSAESAIGWGVKDLQIQYSVDGETWEALAESHQLSRAPGLPTYNSPDDIAFGGVAAKMVRLNIQSNWGGILMSYGLSEVKFSMIPVQARTPEPASGTAGIAPDSVVTWRAGREADQHTIYMSTDMNAVAEGLAPSVDSSTNSVDLGSLSLELGQTYYWRVDEVNQAEAVSVWPGPVWSFSTVESLTVDDFEGYNNFSPDRPFQTWLDGFGYSADEFFPNGYGGNGTGAGIGHDIWSLTSPHYDGDIMETSDAIAGSGQSMPFYYTNTGGVASRTDRTLAVPQDWTIGGIKTLSLAFKGQTGSTGTMFIMINDAKVTYQLDDGNISRGAWQAWNIDLSAVSTNLSSITKLTLGVEGAGASGMILFDDIRLYAKAGELITPEDPGTDGLAGAWSFDEGSGTTVSDSSGNGRNGTIVDATWETGQQGSALLFNGTSAYVNIDGYQGINAVDSVQQAFTISNWVKTTSDAGDTEMVTWGASSGTATRLTWRVHEGRVRTEHNAGNLRGNTYINDGEWHHVALVVTEGANLRPENTKLYVNGSEDSTFSGDDDTYQLVAEHDVRIGMSGPQNGRYFPGSLDEVRIYDRALSAAEILWLAGRTAPIDKPF